MKKVVVMLAVLAITVPVMAFHPNADCDACHIPHTDVIAAEGNLDGFPLWSGEGINNIDATYTVYESATLDAVMGQPAGSTIVCMGCHDTTGRHAFSKNQDDMSTTHPIEFVYDSTLATDDGELVDPGAAGSSTKVAGKGTINEDLLGNNNVMNCVSCHDIHIQGLHGTDFGPVDPATGKQFEGDVPHLVNIPGIQFKLGHRGDPAVEGDWSLSYGALCTTCHIK